MVNFDIIVNHIQQVTGQKFNNIRQSSVSGGGINAAYHLNNDTQSYFVKLNTPERELMFEAEAKGLSELADAQCIRIPKVICFGQTSQNHPLRAPRSRHEQRRGPRCHGGAGHSEQQDHADAQRHAGRGAAAQGDRGHERAGPL